MDEHDLKVSNCLTGEETRQAYLILADSEPKCGKGQPCLIDGCKICTPLLELIEKRGDECLERGCTTARCIYDEPA